MHIVHSHNGRKADEHVGKPVSFFVTNKKGGYLALGNEPFTHMQGLFFFDSKAWSPYKTIENIRLNKPFASIKNNFSTVERTYEGGAEESFTLFNDSVYYQLRNYHGDALIELDFRHIFDYDDKGRFYTVSQTADGAVLVKYEKYSDHGKSKLVTKRYLAIRGLKDWKRVDAWERKNYSYDARRGAKSEFYTYSAISFPVDGNLDLIFSYSENEEDAIKQSDVGFENRKFYLEGMKKYMDHAFNSHDLTFDVAMKAFDDLVVAIDDEASQTKRVGLFAGYPWFFQFWARDELLSIKALIIHGKYNVAKSIMMRYVDSISQEGLIPNRLPESEIKSLDAVGWLFYRLHELLFELGERDLVEKYFTPSDIIRIKQALEKSIQGLINYHTKEGFVVGKRQESWMDTSEARRSGAFIESQAFLLAMMRMHNDLASATKSKPLFRLIEKEFAEKVKQAFFKDGVLCDSLMGELPDETVRPNFFLAYYTYPELLKDSEWKEVFDNALKSLWLDWGGIASIGHNTPYFNVEYSGESDRSYHNGDSWYFMNNIAAICMHRLDHDYYAKYVSRILHASREELLFSGFIGCSAEVSSAKEMRSEGALSQLWSSAMLVEFLYEIRHKKIAL